MALFAVLLGTAAAQAGPKKEIVHAPHYGDTLFHFYQDHYFSAITGLMVSQHFGRVAPHDDEAEVLRGGMLLSYGLHPQAGDVFARLIERNAAPPVRDRAWFFMARIRQQRGLLVPAQEALDRIGAPLQGGLEEDRQLLQAQLLMARQDHAAAARVLDAIKGSPTTGLYARYNLGVALVKTGQAEDAERGLALLDEIGQAAGAQEESRSLRDRANVALGFAALQANKPREARLALQRVRLASPQSNKALLGYGWAAAALNDPQLALVPWTELAGRSVSDSAVLEAQIAVPYAMGEIGAYRAALERYQAAVGVFERERSGLKDSITAIRAGGLVQALLARNPAPGEGGLGALAGIQALPEMPHTAHLVPLLAGHEFQESFKNLRDLQFLAGNLQQWQASLGTFVDMLDNRRRAFAERLPQVRARAGAINLPALQLRRDALAAELTRAQETADAATFANPRERALLGRIASVQASLAQATLAQDSGPDQANAAERLRRAAGALTWQLAQQASARAWEATKGLRDTERALAAARARDAALLAAQQAEPARHEQFSARITELAGRLQALAPRVAALDGESRHQLQDIAVAELERQQERLDVYTAQARLAMAQIHDRAQLARRIEPEAAR